MRKSVAQKVIFELRKVLEDAAINIQDKLDSDELCSLMPDQDINNIKNIGTKLSVTADRLYALEVNPLYELRQKDH